MPCPAPLTVRLPIPRGSPRPVFKGNNFWPANFVMMADMASDGDESPDSDAHHRHARQVRSANDAAPPEQAPAANVTPRNLETDFTVEFEGQRVFRTPAANLVAIERALVTLPDTPEVRKAMALTQAAAAQLNTPEPSSRFDRDRLSAAPGLRGHVSATLSGTDPRARCARPRRRDHHQAHYGKYRGGEVNC